MDPRRQEHSRLIEPCEGTFILRIRIDKLIVTSVVFWKRLFTFFRHCQYLTWTTFICVTQDPAIEVDAFQCLHLLLKLVDPKPDIVQSKRLHITENDKVVVPNIRCQFVFKNQLETLVCLLIMDISRNPLPIVCADLLLLL